MEHQNQTNLASRSHRQAGTSLVVMVVILPLLMTIVAGFFAVAWLLRERARLDSQCRTTVLKLQRDLALELERLLRLNPQAQRLQTQRIAAELRLAAAIASGYAPAIAAARAHLQVITVQQQILGAQQDLILLEAHTLRLRAAGQFSNTVRQRRPIVQRSTGLGARALAVTPWGRRPAPVYRPSFNFSREQQHILSWYNRPWQNLPPWLEGFVDLKGTLRGSCSASLNKGGQQWQPVLRPGKVY